MKTEATIQARTTEVELWRLEELSGLHNRQYNNEVTMQERKSPDQIKLQRARDLIILADSLCTSATHEEEKERLGMHRLVALEVKKLIDEATTEDGTMDSDLGLDLLLFIELKEDGESEAETYRKHVARELEELKSEYLPLS